MYNMNNVPWIWWDLLGASRSCGGNRNGSAGSVTDNNPKLSIPSIYPIHTRIIIPYYSTYKYCLLIIMRRAQFQSIALQHTNFGINEMQDMHTIFFIKGPLTMISYNIICSSSHIVLLYYTRIYKWRCKRERKTERNREREIELNDGIYGRVYSIRHKQRFQLIQTNRQTHCFSVCQPFQAYAKHRKCECYFSDIILSHIWCRNEIVYCGSYIPYVIC